MGASLDSEGNLYIAEYNNATIRKITPSGQVTTLAGSAGQTGTNDGAGSEARFGALSSLAVDGAGTIFVADQFNHTIRKITPAGEVTTFAGSAGHRGTNDGSGSAARFNTPRCIGVDGAGFIYVSDTFNHTIRRITPGGEVTTLAGSAGQSGTNDGPGDIARFNLPFGVAVDSATNAYVADGNSTIRKISPAGAVTTLAGSSGKSGSADGLGTAARFNSPSGVAIDSVGNVYVTDYFNYTIRKITPAGRVTTLAGSVGKDGASDGVGSEARFSQASGIAVDSAGNLYVADALNYRVTKGTPLLQFDTSWGMMVTNGSFNARLIGASGGAVVLETSSNLQTWTPIQTNSLTAAELNFSAPALTNQNQYFRAALSP